jgi:hypothetical protein
MAGGIISHLQRMGGETIYVSGHLSKPEIGRYFFQKQTCAGVAGDYVGVVELNQSRRMFRIEPTGPDGAAELVERPWSEVLCEKLRIAQEATNRVESLARLSPSDFPQLPIPAYKRRSASWKAFMVRWG